MKGYTINKSIDLLESEVEKIQSTPTTTPTAADISYDNTSSHLTADDVQEAIDELNTAIGQIDTGHNYSETETLIGKWIDGSDLYEKTIDTGALPNTSDKSVAHGVANIGKIISVSGYACNTSTNYFLPLPYPQTDVTYQIALYAEETNVHVVTGRDQSNIAESYVTIRYTKATTEAKKTRKK